MSGQKTGFFFDQRDNRMAVAPYCAGKTVLDCFAHTGAFSMYALRGGATSVTAVDSSKLALDIASQNAVLNGFEKNFFTEQADAEKFMEEQSNSKTKYDVVVIDPPALIKSKKNSQAGYRLYKKLNALAMRLVSPGGIFVTSSCSHHLSPCDFRKMIEEAAAKTGRACWLVENRTQSKDHPILLAMPETEYLKMAIIRMA
jgi:23S rRNA (cytosine1962-C5)-methyltransferase